MFDLALVVGAGLIGSLLTAVVGGQLMSDESIQPKTENVTTSRSTEQTTATPVASSQHTATSPSITSNPTVNVHIAHPGSTSAQVTTPPPAYEDVVRTAQPGVQPPVEIRGGNTNAATVVETPGIHIRMGGRTPVPLVNGNIPFEPMNPSHSLTRSELLAKAPLLVGSGVISYGGYAMARLYALKSFVADEHTWCNAISLRTKSGINKRVFIERLSQVYGCEPSQMSLVADDFLADLSEEELKLKEFLVSASRLK